MIVQSVVLYLCAGVVIGAAFFTALAVNARLYTDQRPIAAVALHASRMAFVVAAFAAIATRGAIPLLSTLAGFTLVRVVVLRRATRRTP